MDFKKMNILNIWDLNGELLNPKEPAPNWALTIRRQINQALKDFGVNLEMYGLGKQLWESDHYRLDLLHQAEILMLKRLNSFFLDKVEFQKMFEKFDNQKKNQDEEDTTYLMVDFIKELREKLC